MINSRLIKRQVVIRRQLLILKPETFDKIKLPTTFHLKCANIYKFWQNIYTDNQPSSLLL